VAPYVFSGVFENSEPLRNRTPQLEGPFLLSFSHFSPCILLLSRAFFFSQVNTTSWPLLMAVFPPHVVPLKPPKLAPAPGPHIIAELLSRAATFFLRTPLERPIPVKGPDRALSGLVKDYTPVPPRPKPTFFPGGGGGRVFAPFSLSVRQAPSTILKDLVFFESLD